MARRCPFCYEKVHPLATICPHCRSRLDEAAEPGEEKVGSNSLSTCTALVMGLMGVTTGVLAALLLGFINERRKWEGDQEEL